MSEQERIGRLEVITGCMFSGKTEELLRRVGREEIAKRKFMLFKPTTDTRYSRKEVISHYGRKFPAVRVSPDIGTYNDLMKAVGEKDLRDAYVVAFDEGNFFSDSFVGLCRELVAKRKRVIVAGLDLDFRGEPFGQMPFLMALADHVDKLQAVCVHCGGDATRSQRLVNGKPAPSDTPLIVIGGEENYEARCQKCFNLP